MSFELQECEMHLYTALKRFEDLNYRSEEDLASLPNSQNFINQLMDNLVFGTMKITENGVFASNLMTTLCLNVKGNLKFHKQCLAKI